MLEEFFAQLKEHKLVQWTLGYLAVSFTLIPVLDIVASRFGWSQTAVRCIIIGLATGFFVMLVIAWYHGERGEQRVNHVEKSLLAVLVLLGVIAMWRIAPVPTERVRAATSATAAAPPHSIAVLPFINMSSDQDQDYFAEGISEDLLNLLTRVQPLQVAARTSSFALQGKGLGIPEIAARLHVANVLEGSVRKAGDELRITAQLVRASDGYEIWSQSYDRKLEDIFAIQDGIAADVVENLKVKLLGALPTLRATDPKAYVLYLQARELGRLQTDEAFKSSDALFHQALAIDPGYAPAWVGLARNYLNELLDGLLPNDQGFRQAREATEKALAIDPDYAPAHAELGYLAILQNDLPSAAQHFQRALALDPSDLKVLDNSATLLQSLGRMNPAIAVAEYNVARDPVNTLALHNLGINYLAAGRFDEAIAEFRTVLSLSPDFGGAHRNLGEALLFKGDAPAALAEMQQEKIEIWRLAGLTLAYHALGQKAQSDGALATWIARYSKDHPYVVASFYAYRGEADQAFQWLDKAVQSADPGLSFIPVDNHFDSLHADPRWLPFLRRIGKAPEQLAKILFTVTLPEAGGAASDATAPTSATSTSTDKP